ncbi:Uracil phosphoribosyltransferase [Phytophthora cinnamomi]|uniref:Uracil phosphoribosyltransferase n=1 Tax=Phytophthora cinnamomi TaxID=4785 RepID=UPI003559A90B|nr:Uracil phosphoribosyltransferase [Phytophthora cinnamomi]
MDPSPSALPQLSSYLQPTRSVGTPDTSIEIAISALTHHFETQLHKRKQPSPSVDKGSTGMASFPGPVNKFYVDHERREAQLMMTERYSSSSSHGGDTPGSEPRSYFAAELSPTTPRRERTSRYLSEGDRKEIIARIDGGEKQVALAKEFNVSRAAICNLYKNRWEVLTRGVRDPTATHPKRSRKKASPRQTSPAAHTTAVAAAPSTANLDTPSISTYANTSPLVALQARQDQSRQDEYLSWPSTPLDTSSQPRHHNLERHHNLLQDEASPRPREHETRHEVAVDGPVVAKRFLVHEASAYSYPCRNLVATLRDESISTVVFQQRATRLARLLIEEVLTCLPHDEEESTNSYGDLCHAMKALDATDFCAVSMEDKGMMLLRAFSDISPATPTGVVSIEDRPSTCNSSGLNVPSRHIFALLPPIDPRQFVLLLDIECAAGEKACAVLNHLVHERQVPARNIYFATMISAFEGLQNVFRHFPDVSLVTAQVDTVLDDQQRIRPGFGDFAQRYCNVCPAHSLNPS